jgi:hypothetical protein
MIDHPVLIEALVRERIEDLRRGAVNNAMKAEAKQFARPAQWQLMVAAGFIATGSRLIRFGQRLTGSAARPGVLPSRA